MELVEINGFINDNNLLGQGSEVAVYNYDDQGLPHVKPEFIIGISTLSDENFMGECKFFKKEDILNKNIE